MDLLKAHFTEYCLVSKDDLIAALEASLVSLRAKYAAQMEFHQEALKIYEQNRKLALQALEEVRHNAVEYWTNHPKKIGLIAKKNISRPESLLQRGSLLIIMDRLTWVGIKNTVDHSLIEAVTSTANGLISVATRYKMPPKAPDIWDHAIPQTETAISKLMGTASAKVRMTVQDAIRSGIAESAFLDRWIE